MPLLPCGKPAHVLTAPPGGVDTTADGQVPMQLPISVQRKALPSSFFFFRTTPAAYGGAQARGQVGAAAAGLHHSSWQRQILNPLREARDRTCNLMAPS